MDLSEEDILDRKNTLKQFENYFNNTKNKLKDVVEQIGWTLDKTPMNEVLVTCPYNSEHRMLPSKLNEHCQTCLLKQNGYDSTHSLYPSYNYSTSVQSIKIDKVVQMNILKSAYEESNFTLNVKHEPREVSQSIERYVCDFTPDERRILYDSAVKNTKTANHDSIKTDLTCVDVFNTINKKPKTKLELLQEQRDLKRRRAAYRGKRVHTDRKSYVEVLREVVEGLTNSLSQKCSKSLSVETSNDISETVTNNRLVYKYEGNQNYSGNPYIRWLGIEKEEAKLSKYYEEKRDFSSQNTSETLHSKDKINIKKSRRSRSRSGETRRSNNKLHFRRSRSRSKCKGSKYTNFKRSRSPLMFKETKSKRLTTRSKSKETLNRSRSRSLGKEYKHKKSNSPTTLSKSKDILYKRSRSRSISKKRKKSKSHKSKETLFKRSRSRSMSLEYKHKKSKKHKTQSKSSEIGTRKRNKHCSNSPTNKCKTSQLNENNMTVEQKSSNNYKKKKKKKKSSKSLKRSHKSNKNTNIEVSENSSYKIFIDDSIPSTSYQ